MVLRIVLGALICSICVPVTAGFVLLRAWSPDSAQWQVLLASMPWVLVLTVIGLVGALLIGPRRRVAVVVLAISVALAVPQVLWQLPSYVGSHASGPANLTVMELNLRLGRADPTQTVALVRSHHASLLVVSEATPEALSGLRAAGLATLLPHTAGGTDPGRSGLMVFSRYRLSPALPVVGATSAFSTTVGAAHPFRLIAAHAAQLTSEPLVWYADLAALRIALGTASADTMLVGDLNATVDQGPVRALLGAGLADAAQAADSGWQPTWPGSALAVGGVRPLGLVAIDHVLVGRDFGVVDTSTDLVAHTDHRALIVGLRR